MVDCEESVQAAVASSGWRVIGTTEGIKLRTKTQAESERRRVAQAQPQVLFIHLKTSFGTTRKAQKAAIKPFAHTLDLGVHLLDRKAYVAFEGRTDSTLLRHATFNRISETYSLQSTRHRWCNLEVGFSRWETDNQGSAHCLNMWHTV